ncbi:MAG: leupeptin-inactivating enzyme 1 [Planctomycetota bacterium]|jgi:hypothetical protein
MARFGVLACAATAALSLGSAAFAVDRLVPAQYATIQAAIDAAIAGDTVLVSPGAYNERLNTKGKAITVKGQFGYAQTIIDPLGAAGVLLTVNTGETLATTIEGITFRNSVSGAVGIVSAGLTVRNCRFLGNSASGAYGAAVNMQAGQIVVEQSSFLVNGFPCIQGGAIYSAQGSSAHFTGCTFEGNRANYNGGAIWHSAGGPLSLVQCVLRENQTVQNYPGGGGAIWVEASTSLAVSACEFSSNLAYSVGGAIAAINTPIDIDATNFLSNAVAQGQASGGAIYLAGCSGSIDSCAFTDSLANGGSGSSGGSLYVASCSPMVRDCSFTGCRATSFGGSSASGGSVALASGASPQFLDCDWVDSRAECTGSTSGYLYYASPRGGTFHCLENCHPRLYRCVFNGSRCRAATSGTWYSSAYGGALWLKRSNAYLEDCFFGNCAAVDESPNNSQDSFGGVIWAEDLSAPTIVRTRFVGSVAKSGGAMHLAYSFPFVLNSVFAGGSGSDQGGVIRSDASGPNFAGCLFQNNAAPTGSVCYATTTNSSRPSIGTSVFCGNSGVDVVGPWYDEPGNTMLETCTGDCDANGITDSWEISTGQAVDCNANQVPDACDIASNPAIDGNGDGIPDSCQSEFAGLVTEIVPITAPGTGLPTGAVCWRVYARFISADATLLGIFGDAVDTLSITAAGGFWQSAAPEAGDLPTGIPCTGAPANVRYDSYLTVGAECGDGTPLAQIGIDFSGFAAGSVGLSNPSNGGIVYVAANGVAAGADRRVLLMQLTTNTGVKPTGQFNLVGEESPAAGGGEWQAMRLSIPNPALVDCNGNSQHDALEIAAGTVTDCDLNGVPDACQSATATVDCDADGTSDFCEFAAGSADSNNNGKPDECDCVADANGDGAVNVDDLIDVIVAWGDMVSGGPNVDGIGVVDSNDLALVLSNWGSCVPITPPGQG